MCRWQHVRRGPPWSHQRYSATRTMMPGMEPAMLIRVWVMVWRKMTGEAVVQLQVQRKQDMPG